MSSSAAMKKDLREVIEGLQQPEKMI